MNLPLIITDEQAKYYIVNEGHLNEDEQAMLDVWYFYKLIPKRLEAYLSSDGKYIVNEFNDRLGRADLSGKEGTCTLMADTGVLYYGKEIDENTYHFTLNRKYWEESEEKIKKFYGK